MCSGLFYELDREWRAVVTSAESRRALARWADDPVLADLDTLDDVLVRTSAEADSVAANSVLLALVRRAPDDGIAARAALQALLPGLRRVALRMSSTGDRHDVAAEAIAAAWANIRTYPSNCRPDRVAANVILDVFHVLWRRCLDARREQPADPTDFVILGEPDHAPTAGPTARDVLEVVAESGDVPTVHLQLVADAVLDRRSAADAARLLGITAKAMERRRERARARVVSAYRTAAMCPDREAAIQLADRVPQAISA